MMSPPGGSGPPGVGIVGSCATPPQMSNIPMMPGLKGQESCSQSLAEGSRASSPDNIDKSNDRRSGGRYEEDRHEDDRDMRHRNNNRQPQQNNYNNYRNNNNMNDGYR